MDRALVERARAGDAAAFEEIVRDRMDAVYRLSFAILGSEADARDAAQEAFVSSWRQLRRLRDPDRFDAWLTRIAVNAARMTARARNRRRVREIPVEEIARASNAPTSRTDADLLRAALAHLPVDQRTLLALHHLEDRPISEIAALLDIPAGTVKSRLFTARQALDRALADEEARR